jgi:excisionase family DNA binding protein
MSDRLLTTRELASYLGVSPETVLRRWRAGELPGFRIASNALRFDPDEVRAWLERCRHVTVAGRADDPGLVQPPLLTPSRHPRVNAPTTVQRLASPKGEG